MFRYFSVKGSVLFKINWGTVDSPIPSYMDVLETDPNVGILLKEYYTVNKWVVVVTLKELFSLRPK